MQGGFKKSRFSTNISEMMPVKVVVTFEGEYEMKPYPSFRMVPFQMTFSYF